MESSAGWPIVEFRPGSNPLESLAIESLASAGPTVGRGDPRAGFRPRADRNILHVTCGPRPGEAPAARLVILADQFEEIFTLCTDETLRRALIENLLHAATVVGGPALVLLTMRADFFGKCAAYPDWPPPCRTARSRRADE